MESSRSRHQFRRRSCQQTQTALLPRYLQNYRRTRFRYQLFRKSTTRSSKIQWASAKVRSSTSITAVISPLTSIQTGHPLAKKQINVVGCRVSCASLVRYYASHNAVAALGCLHAMYVVPCKPCTRLCSLQRRSLFSNPRSVLSCSILLACIIALYECYCFPWTEVSDMYIL